MQFVSGASLTCNDWRFGGWSGLTAADGRGDSFVSVSDRNGVWAVLPASPRTGDKLDLHDLGGHDAEAVTVTPDLQSSFVSFEEGGGVMRYSGILEHRVGTVDSIGMHVRADCGFNANEQYEVLEALDGESLSSQQPRCFTCEAPQDHM